MPLTLSLVAYVVVIVVSMIIVLLLVLCFCCIHIPYVLIVFLSVSPFSAQATVVCRQLGFNGTSSAIKGVDRGHSKVYAAN